MTTEPSSSEPQKGPSYEPSPEYAPFGQYGQPTTCQPSSPYQADLPGSQPTPPPVEAPQSFVPAQQAFTAASQTYVPTPQPPALVPQPYGPVSAPYAQPQQPYAPASVYGPAAHGIVSTPVAHGAYQQVLGGMPVARPEMGFVQAWKAFFANYANFNGRASKSEFAWPMWTSGAFGGVAFAIGFLSMFPALVNETVPTEVEVAVMMMTWGLGALLWIALIVPSLAVTARRMHDMNQSGWFSLLHFLGDLGHLGVLIWGSVGESDPRGARFDDPTGRQPSTGA